jgi:hypothetical protein
MVNYGNGLIYKLCCKDPIITDEYIGSTCNKNRRKQQHKSCCNNENTKEHNRLVYQFIRANGGFDNFDLIIIEEYPCESKVQLEMKEREYIERLRPTLNKQIPTRTLQEYRETHREEIREYHKQYREENIEEIKEYKKRYIDENIEEIKEYQREYYEKHKEDLLEQNKEYRETHRESISEYHKHYREEHKASTLEYNKQYRDKHKEEISERNKQYYDQHKEEISEKQKQKFDCECGGRYINTGKNRHMKTQRHLKYLEDLNKL